MTSFSLPRYVDFRVVYPLVFVVANTISLLAFRGWDLDFILLYLTLSFLFFISLWLGSKLITHDILQHPVRLARKILLRYIVLFVLSQIFYGQYIYLFFFNKLTGFESFRFSIEDQVNMYFGQFAFVFLLLGLSYVIYDFVYSWKESRSDSFIGKSIIAISFFLITLGELIIGGSRSVVLLLLLVVGMLLVKFNVMTKRILFICGIISIFFIGWAAYLRISSDPSTLQWWITQNIIDPDANPLLISFKMIWHTFSGIGERTVMLINCLANGEISHQFGYDTFFYFVSILPGKQINPSVWLNHYVYYGSDNEVGYPPTIIAQMYWDFGMLGVPVMGFLIGMLGSWLFKKAHSPHIVWSILYALFLGQCLLSIYGEFRLGWLLANIMLFVVIDYFFRGKIRF